MYLVNLLNLIIWEYVLVYGLLAVGVFFTIRLGFAQFTSFGEMIRCTLGTDKSDKEGISPFQALTVSLASRIGTGNLAGVAVALHWGGPGAIFWMWVTALIGMSTSFAESSLAQLYKVHDPDGDTYRGGPAQYIAKGLGKPLLATAFAVVLVLSLGVIMNAVQANAVAEAMAAAFSIPPIVTGLVVAGLVGAVIFGGLRSISRMAEYLVPVMALAYLAVVAVICVMNASLIPGVLSEIVSSAFGFQEAAGGAAGGVTAALLNGVKRGIFSNEAGMGSAPNIAGSATPVPHHPASQGFVQALGVFVDTIVICTATAAMIMLSGAHTDPDLNGIAMTQVAAQHFMGDFGLYFIAVVIFLFAVTTIIACYSYAESGMNYLGLGKSARLMVLRVAVIGIVIWGSLQAVNAVFAIADAAMGVMAAMNLVAIVSLSSIVVTLGRDYVAQRKAGKVPHFKISEHEDIAKGVERDIWS